MYISGRSYESAHTIYVTLSICLATSFGESSFNNGVITKFEFEFPAISNNE